MLERGLASIWRRAGLGQALTDWMGIQGAAAAGVVLILLAVAGGNFDFMTWFSSTVTESNLFGDGGGSTGLESVDDEDFDSTDETSDDSEEDDDSDSDYGSYGYGDGTTEESVLTGTPEDDDAAATLPSPPEATDSHDAWANYHGAQCDACYENFVNSVKGYEYEGDFHSRTDPGGTYRFRTQADADEYDNLMRGTTFNPHDGQVYNPDGSVMSDYLFTYSQQHAFYN